jgi:hypothetical protein
MVKRSSNLSVLTQQRIATEAELYTPDGVFVKSHDADPPIELYAKSAEPLRVAGVLIRHNVFGDRRIGILVKADGSVAFGVQ